MKYIEKSWKTADNLNIFARLWVPNDIPKATILFVHGLGEHSGRYKHWGEKFADKNYVFCAFDTRGHGQSEGVRGHSKSYSLLIKDISTARNIIKELYLEIPVFLYGHSFGGNQVLNYIIDKCNGFKGLIVTSPWLKLSQKISNYELIFANFLSAFAPKLKFSNRIKPESLARTNTTRHEYVNDSLNYHKISLKLFCEAHERGLIASGSIYKINVPMLIMHGTADQVTSYKATREFVQNAGSFTKFVSWEDGYHELHNDTDQQEVFNTILTWLNTNLDD